MSDENSNNERSSEREDALNKIIISIAMEEIALSHVINAEGEKIQYALGTLDGSSPPDPATIKQILALNKSVQETLEVASQQQMLLKSKLQLALSAPTLKGDKGDKGDKGEQGIQGVAGTVGTIKGAYDSIEQLRAAHPSGEAGDFYLVDPDLFVWDSDNNDWYNVGQIAGPQGIQGVQGEKGDTGEQGEKGDTGEKGDKGDKGEDCVPHMIIPFCSQMAPRTFANASGQPTRVTLLGFGYFYTGNDLLFIPDTSIVLDSSGWFQLNTSNSNSNRQLVFSLPFDTRIESLYITVGNYGLFSPSGSVFPFVQLYSATPNSNQFAPLAGAQAIPTQGIGPGLTAADTMRSAYKTDINLVLPAGTRLAIGGLMQITGDTLARDYYLYFTGGVGMSRVI